MLISYNYRPILLNARTMLLLSEGAIILRYTHYFYICMWLLRREWRIYGSNGTILCCIIQYLFRD